MIPTTVTTSINIFSIAHFSISVLNTLVVFVSMASILQQLVLCQSNTKFKPNEYVTDSQRLSADFDIGLITWIEAVVSRWAWLA